MIHVDYPKPLNREQQAFAEANHGLLLKFMGVHRLDDECYGVMAERYLKTVIEYLEDESIQKYAFSTILWYRLRADLFKMRRRSIKVGDPLLIDTCARTIGQSDEPSTDLFWSEIADQITEQQLELLYLRSLGFQPKEIGRLKGCSGHAISCRIHRIKKKLKKSGLL